MIKRLTLLFFLSVPCLAEQVAVSQFKYLNTNENSLIIDASEAQDLLNVDITPGGKSVKKRSGYGLYKTVFSESAGIHGGFHGFDSTGNDVQIWGSSRSLVGIVADATPATIVSSMTLNATIDCADTQGSFYCVNSSRDFYIKTNGATLTSWHTSPLGTMVEATPDRIAVAGLSGTPNTIYVSGSNAFTTFTVGPLTTDPFTEVIAAPGSKLTHLRWGCQKLLWWKDQSFGYFDFEDQYSGTVNIVSDNIGTVDNTSAIDPGGSVWFRGQDGHVYQYDCSGLVKQTIEITPQIQTSGRRTSNSWTQTTLADFNAGSIGYNGPSLALSTAIVSGAIYPSSITIQDTSSTDFGSGTSFGTGIDTFTVSGAVTLRAYLADTFANFNNWTSEGCGVFCTGTMSANSGKMACSTSGGCQAVSTVTVNGDFLLSYVPTDGGGGGSSAIAALNNSQAGYGIEFSNGGSVVGIREYSNFSDKSSGSSSKCTGGVSTSGSTYLLTRNAATNTMTLYKDGVEECNTTDSSVTSFTNIRVYTTGDSAHRVDDVYDTARVGNFNSRAFDTAFSTPVYGTFTANTSGTGSFAHAVRTSAASGSGYGTDAVIVSGGAIFNGSHKRYLVYSSTLTATTSATSLPQLTDVTAIAASTGTFYSAVKNAPNITTWDTFIPTYSNDNGSHSFYIRSSTNSFTILSSTPAWTAQTPGAAITISTGTYFQIRDDFSVNSATQAPVLNDFTINWFEGTAGDQSYLLYFDNAIWASVAYGVGVSSNNYVFKRDLINDGWTLYSFGAGGFLVQNNRLYFGNVSDGKVMRYGSGTDDNGSAITAYWKSKDFTASDPFLQSQLTQIDIFAKQNTNQSLTATYSTDTSSSTSYTVNLAHTSQSFIQNRKLLPTGKNGYTFNMKVGDATTSSAWEVFGFRLSYTTLPWKPTQ